MHTCHSFVKKGSKALSVLFGMITWCLSFSWKSAKLYTMVRIVVEILTPVLTIVAVFIGRCIINILAGQYGASDSRQVLIFLLFGLLAVAIVRRSVNKLLEYCQTMHEDVMEAKISLMILDSAIYADLEYFDNPQYHDKLISAHRDSFAIKHIVWNTISGVSSIISFMTAFVMLSQASWLYGVILLIAAIPSSIVGVRYTKLLYRLGIDQINERRRMEYCKSVATQKLYAQEIRLFQSGNMIKSRYKRIWQNLFTIRRGVIRKRTILVGALECLPEIALGVIVVDVALKVFGGLATVGDYSLYAGLVTQLFSSISILMYSLMNIYDNKMQLENFNSIKSFENHVLETGTKPLDSVETIEFKNVSFYYPGTKELVLKNINFCLRKDEKVALVGLNGSGKTTLIKLLLRLYDPNNGIIRINGVDIREYNLSSLRSNFSVYFQDAQNYCFSLRENFTIADDEYEDADQRINQALLAADSDDILKKSANGLDTSLTRYFDDDGIELSGGQNQKIAIARTLFRKHSAIVLDEPSSNLDPKAEHVIFESLKKLTEGKMTIFTSHRLSNVFLANRIIVLDKGCIVEDGTQRVLLNNRKQYAELFKYQQDKYIDFE